MTITGTVYTNPSGLGEGWDDRNAADHAFADALAAHFEALGWDIIVKRGEGSHYVEGTDERDAAHEVNRVFEAFCAHDGDPYAAVEALHGEGA